MKVYNILTIMLAGAAASAVQSHAGAGRPMAERELVALMREIDRAHQTSDVATFDRIWADDYVLTDYRGIIKDRARALAEWKASEHRYASYVSDHLPVRAHRAAARPTTP